MADHTATTAARADARAVIDRRAALSALAAFPALATSAAAATLDGVPGSLSAAISAHGEAHQAFLGAIDAVAAVETARRRQHTPEVEAAEEAVLARRDEADQVEDEALTAVCAHRCASEAEIAAKARYLAPFRDRLDAEHLAALFASMLPAGEPLGAR